MPNEDLLIEQLVSKIDEANVYFLTKIGELIKRIRDLKPSQAQQLIQILKYGGNYEDILNKLSKLTQIPKKEIESIFAEYAKKDLYFAKNFYEYRNIPFKPYNQNTALKRQVKALSNITSQTLENLTRSRALGYTIKDAKGVPKFYGLRQTYEKLLDEALLNVGQGKETFDSSMTRILKELGGSGLKTLDYASGRSYRLDSMVRMHLKSGLRDLHNEDQRLFGEEYGADGVEISVHINPAEDHQDAQGRQFSYEEFNKLQDTGIATTYQGKEINMTTGSENQFHRPISEYNCYHYTFAIVLGVSKPIYNDEQLKKIIDNNKKGFEYKGKHYTMYEGTQLQRELERKIREQKDINILAKESDNKELDFNSRYKITILNNQYKELSQVSGLPKKPTRTKVSGYTGKPVKIETKVVNKHSSLYKEEDYINIKQKLKDKGIIVNDNVDEIPNIKLKTENLEQIDHLTDKYNVNRYSDSKFNLNYKDHKRSWMGWANYKENSINLSKKFYKDEKILLESEYKARKSGWHYKTPDNKLDIYTITHEYGHIIEYEYYKKSYKIAKRNGSYFNFNQADKDLRDTLINKAMKKANEKLSISEFKKKYFSGYGLSKRNDEWFAELFAQHELGEKTPFTEALDEWLEVFFK